MNICQNGSVAYLKATACTVLSVYLYCHILQSSVNRKALEIKLNMFHFESCIETEEICTMNGIRIHVALLIIQRGATKNIKIFIGNQLSLLATAILYIFTIIKYIELQNKIMHYH